MKRVFLSVPTYNWCTPFKHPSSCVLVNHGPSLHSLKKNTSHGNEVLPQDTMHFIQRPRYQRGSPCQVPAGNRTAQRPPDHHKEMQTAVVWTCLPFIRSDQNRLARHSEKGKQRTGWQGNTGEWIGLEFAMCQRAVKNREKWRKLFMKSPVVPQWPSWLRDRWGEVRVSVACCHIALVFAIMCLYNILIFFIVSVHSFLWRSKTH